MSLNLDSYLDRIGYQGSRAPDYDTLCAVQSHHARAIPYEAIDVFLGRPVDQDLTRIFEKLVVQKRGGWCYEMNGLLGWALTEMGFEVTRICGGVMRALRGDEAMGNHLVLRVDLDEPLIVDVGLGDGHLTPLRLQEGEQKQGHRVFTLERLEDDMWRCQNHEGAMPPNYDFSVGPADEALFARVGQDLQDDPDSMFRQNLVCQMMTEETTKVLLGRVYVETHTGQEKRLLQSEDELLGVLETAFGLRVSDPTGLWEKVVARHEELFGADANSALQSPSP